MKASNTHAEQQFGASIALSGSGDLLAVAAPYEDNVATGVDGIENNFSDLMQSGAVYVYRWSAGQWSKQTYIKAANAGSGDNLGQAVALSTDGGALAVSAHHEDSSATGVGGQFDNLAMDAGALYLY